MHHPSELNYEGNIQLYQEQIDKMKGQLENCNEGIKSLKSEKEEFEKQVCEYLRERNGDGPLENMAYAFNINNTFQRKKIKSHLAAYNQSIRQKETKYSTIEERIERKENKIADLKQKQNSRKSLIEKYNVNTDMSLESIQSELNNISHANYEKFYDILDNYYSKDDLMYNLNSWRENLHLENDNGSNLEMLIQKKIDSDFKTIGSFINVENEEEILKILNNLDCELRKGHNYGGNSLQRDILNFLASESRKHQLPAIFQKWFQKVSELRRVSFVNEGRIQRIEANMEYLQEKKEQNSSPNKRPALLKLMSSLKIKLEMLLEQYYLEDYKSVKDIADSKLKSYEVVLQLLQGRMQHESNLIMAQRLATLPQCLNLVKKDDCCSGNLHTTQDSNILKRTRGETDDSTASFDECSICLEKVLPWEQIATLQCSHKFHRSCIERWLDVRNGCPLCNRKVCLEEDFLE